MARSSAKPCLRLPASSVITARQPVSSHNRSNTSVRADQEQLAIALAERSKLQRQIAAMKRDAELTWTAERIENALIRERINDVACEVVRITEALQRPGSSIEPISAYAARVPGHEERTAILGINDASGEARTITNAGAPVDRVRALRTVASRAAAN